MNAYIFFFMVIPAVLFIIYAAISICIFYSDCDMLLRYFERYGKSPFRLQGKVILITGATNGIGKFTAYALAVFGAKMALTAEEENELQCIKEKCIDMSNGLLEDKDILVIPADITNFGYHKDLVQKVLDHFGCLDILLNNAERRSQRTDWENIELAEDKQMFDMNVFASVNLTRVALKYFQKKGFGHVAVVTNIAELTFAEPKASTYTATKYALKGYFNSLRSEKIEENIYVTILCLGPTFAFMLRESFRETENQRYRFGVEATIYGMSRCGYLIAVALANRTKESWIVVPPLMGVAYKCIYFPNVYGRSVEDLGRTTFNRLLRDQYN